eukprot:TRINITY_DN2675_c0_g1_i2.p1 TRINITY_DN2675_c0_g1~~TRINITY_DN2675_c0_g1_i2.p1  ORF type:complete len:136 (+),score=20.05 TRINITY_DN2675_c0_g1_i2:224-631(+)
MDGVMQDMICSGCGKDPYKSSTGCLCDPDDGHQWGPGQGSYGRAPELERDATGQQDHGGPITCSCGRPRERAAMDQRRVMPCHHCGDDGRNALEMITQQEEEFVPIPGCTYCKQCKRDISTTPDMCPECDGPRFP